METYFTVGELAQYLKVAEQTIRRWVLNREVPFCKIKKSIRFRLSEVEAWVNNSGVLAAARGTVDASLPNESGGLFAGTETETRGEA